MAIRLGWYIGPGPDHSHQYYNAVPTLITQGHDLFYSYVGLSQDASGRQDDIEYLKGQLSGSALLLVQIYDGYYDPAKDDYPNCWVISPPYNDGIWQIERDGNGNSVPKMDARINYYKTEPKSLGYYTEEPNLEVYSCPNGTYIRDDRWSGNTMNIAQSKVTTVAPTKEFVVMIKDEASDYSVYAPGCTILGGENYPCQPNTAPQWPSLINTVRDTAMRVQAAKSKRFMALQGEGTSDFGKREPSVAELRWMTHMTLIHGVTNILYWDYDRAVKTPTNKLNPDPDNGMSMVNKVATVVGQIRTKNVDDILDGTNLDGQAVDNQGITDVAYRLYGGDYYLLAAHQNPGTTSGGTASFTCEVDGQQIIQAENILTGQTRSGTMKATKFIFTDSVAKGEVKVYHLLTIA